MTPSLCKVLGEGHTATYYVIGPLAQGQNSVRLLLHLLRIVTLATCSIIVGLRFAS